MVVEFVRNKSRRQERGGHRTVARCEPGRTDRFNPIRNPCRAAFRPALIG